MKFLFDQWQLTLPLALGWIAVWRLLPSDGSRARLLLALMGLASLLLAQSHLAPPPGGLIEDSLFYLFGGMAVICAVLMISVSNPVYSALWFAVSTMGVCGLFLLNSAPFLAAATVIVYAGAIIVTFLFVIMLAQQQGISAYDHRANHPFWATFSAFVLMGAFFYTLHGWGGRSLPGSVGQQLLVPTVAAGSFSGNPEPGTLRGLGVTLFTDYLFAVELAGTILLVATIGAIALAPRRSGGSL